MMSLDFLAEVQRNMERQMIKDFQSQNPDVLDAIFEIDGRKLYAHRLRLSVASPTFKSMLSDRWSSKNETIKINGYDYNHFKELLTFIYSGEPTEENMNEMIKTEITPLLPYIKFKKMQLKFLNTFVVERGFIFSNDELSDILKNADPEPDVEISFLLKQSIYDPYYSYDYPPRLPFSGYMIWLSENRKRLTQPGMDVADITKASIIEWFQLENKNEWQKLADDDNKRYEREMAEYTMESGKNE